MQAKKDNSEGSNPSGAVLKATAAGPFYPESQQVTLDEMLTACRKARVRVTEHFRPDDTAPAGYSSRGFFHQLGNGEEHGPFGHEDQAYEDAFHNYYLLPW